MSGPFLAAPTAVPAPDGTIQSPATQPTWIQGQTVPAAFTPVAPITAEFKFTQADIDAAREKVRQEEKDKLYGEITQTKESLQQLQQAQQAREAEETRIRESAEADKRKAEEAELSAKELIERRDLEFKRMLEERESAWKSEFSTLQEAYNAEQALRAKELQFNNLKAYIQTKVTENANTIAPQLVNLIQGNSEPEVDASVARAIEATNALQADLAQYLPQPGQFVPAPAVPASPMVPGVSTASGPTLVDPQQQYAQLTAEQINAMDMPTYEKYRAQLGVVGSRGSNVGMYG